MRKPALLLYLQNEKEVRALAELVTEGGQRPPWVPVAPEHPLFS